MPLKILSRLTVLAFAVALVATLCTASRYGPGLWPPGARLFYFSGAVLVGAGLLSAYSPRIQEHVWARRTGGAGLFTASIGLAMLAVASEYDDGQHPWLLLLVPLGVSVMMLGVHMHRRPATDRYEPLPAVFVPLFVVAGLLPILVAYIDLTG